MNLRCSGVTSRHFVYSFCLNMVICCIAYSDCYFLGNNWWHSVGNQHSCCFLNFLQLCHKTCCFAFQRIVKKYCDCFGCPCSYCQGIVNDDSLVFSTVSAWGTFDMSCQLLEINDPMRYVYDYTVISQKMQTYFWPCQFLHHDETFCKYVISNIKFKSGCC